MPDIILGMDNYIFSKTISSVIITDNNTVEYQEDFDDHFKSTLAQAMIIPLRTNLDYVGICRTAFLVDQLPEGCKEKYTDDGYIEVIPLVGISKDK